MIVFDRRAAAILCQVLRTRADRRPFLMPANACAILPETLAAAGQPVELVDVAEPWLEIDRDACLARLRERPNGYGGLLFIHPYGSERDATNLFAALKETQRDLFLIDDKCLCRPDLAGDSLSPLADLSLFSTGHAKYADLDGGGFGHFAAAAAYGGIAPPTEYPRHVIDAARAADEHKALLNGIYSRALPREIQLPAELQQWRFNIRVQESSRLVASIFASGLFASRHFASLGRFAIAERLHADVVNLFNDRSFDTDRARRVSEVVLRHLETVGP